MSWHAKDNFNSAFPGLNCIFTPHSCSHPPADNIYMPKYFLLLLSLMIIHSSFGQTDAHWQSKISPSLWENSIRGKALSFLVVLEQQSDLSDAQWLRTKKDKAEFVFQSLTQTASETQRNISRVLDENNISYRPLYIINAIRVHGNKDLIQSLAQRSEVAQILNDENIISEEPIETAADGMSDRSVIEWGIEMIHADDVWAMGFRGQGVTVGGEDTGYDWTHPALIQQYRGYDAVSDTADHNYNWHDAIHDYNPANADSNNLCGIDLLEPCDDFGHGTHTMGTMIGLDGDNEIGVAPEADWCGCRNMERGWGTLFSYIECFEWFLAPTDLNNENPDPSRAPHVINNSWTCPLAEGCDSSNFEIMNMVVNNLRASGIVVVVSAGNDGPGCSTISKPASMFEGSFTVGATASNDTIAGFSSRGHVTADSSFRIKPNICAPGVSVRSARPGGAYGNSSGTSMAGPHVAGVVALMISANPELAGQVEVIEDIIEHTAIPKTTDQECGGLPGFFIPNNTYGYGRIDALAAVEAALALIETSTEEESLSTLVKVYPNPFSNELLIGLNQVRGEVQFELYDMQGRVMHKEKMSGDFQSLHHINMSDQMPGIYFYRICNEGTVQAGKLAKKG